MNSQLTLTKKWMLSHQFEAFLIKTILGSALIALFAQVSVPMWPVPITGQTLAVTIVGFALGRNAGVAAVLLYLYQGCVGLPVFAGGSAGFASIIGPSGGYLYGFIFSAAILGHFSDKGVLNNFWKSFAVAIVASAVIFAFGLFQLWFFVPSIIEGMGKTAEELGGLTMALLNFGLLPFIVGGVIKALLASVLVVPAYRFVSKM